MVNIVERLGLRDRSAHGAGPTQQAGAGEGIGRRQFLQGVVGIGVTTLLKNADAQLLSRADAQLLSRLLSRSTLFSNGRPEIPGPGQVLTLIQDGIVASSLPGSTWGMFNATTGLPGPLRSEDQAGGPFSVGRRMTDPRIPRNAIHIAPGLFADHIVSRSAEIVSQSLDELLGNGTTVKNAPYIMMGIGADRKPMFYAGIQRTQRLATQLLASQFVVNPPLDGAPVRISPLDITVQRARNGSFAVDAGRNSINRETGLSNPQYSLYLKSGERDEMGVALAEAHSVEGVPHTPAYFFGRNGYLLMLPSSAYY